MSSQPDHQRSGTRDRFTAESSRPEASETARKQAEALDRPREIGGRGGLEPTRYGDWEKNGRCIDF